jgi:8-hydroxy-5-deazaflavin:NADPH oxidoreductase
MNISILGTGIVGRSHAEKLSSLGHTIFIGTNSVEKTRTSTKSDDMGNPAYGVWAISHPEIQLVSFQEAVNASDIVINALKGEISVQILSVYDQTLIGKILIDISNPLDFSTGMPPTLFVSNTDSLGEQIQRTLPKTNVIKTFNTMSAPVQVNPKSLAHGEHTIFLCGNDLVAKNTVISLIKSYGWTHIIDLGDIRASRGMEMLLPNWLSIWQKYNTPLFNIKIVTNEIPTQY